jgi:cytochrome P450
MLPPGPSTPREIQTFEWLARPTALLRRCLHRYGDPFTLRTHWMDAPLVVVSDPAEIKRIFAAKPEVLTAGQSSTILEPFAGSQSILVLDGPEHMRQRKLMLPPFHGEKMQALRGVVAEVAEAEIARWPMAGVMPMLSRMQALTLEVIMRAVFGLREGAELRELSAAIRRTLDMTTSLPRLIAMTLVQSDRGPRAAFHAAVKDVDALLYDVIRRRRTQPSGDSILDMLLAARHEDGSPPTDAELRDQLVTLLAAGHETTAGSLAWALERLARHPHVVERLREDDDAYLDAVIKEVLRVRPVLSIAGRTVKAPFSVGGYDLPVGVHVAPCIYLVQRRPDLYPDPTAFRPERFLDGKVSDAYAWIPFGGGIRRCLGAAFATMEMREVLRAAVARVDLRPDRPEGERMRRRSITLTPARGARVMAIPLPRTLRSPIAPCPSSAATTA